MHDALNVVIRSGVVGIGSTFDWVQPRIDVVPCWRTHGSHLEAPFKLHAFGGEFVNVRCVSLTAISAEVTKSTIVGNNENEIGIVSDRR